MTFPSHKFHNMIQWPNFLRSCDLCGQIQCLAHEFPSWTGLPKTPASWGRWLCHNQAGNEHSGIKQTRAKQGQTLKLVITRSEEPLSQTQSFRSILVWCICLECHNWRWKPESQQPTTTGGRQGILLALGSFWLSILKRQRTLQKVGGASATRFWCEETGLGSTVQPREAPNGPQTPSPCWRDRCQRGQPGSMYKYIPAPSLSDLGRKHCVWGIRFLFAWGSLRIRDRAEWPCRLLPPPPAVRTSNCSLSQAGWKIIHTV